MPPIPYDSSDAYLRSAVDASLQPARRRGHRPLPDPPARHVRPPGSGRRDPRRPRRRAARSAPSAISNHTPAQHDALVAHLGDLPLATSQPEYSPAFLGPLRDGTFDACMRDGVVPLAWSPLGRRSPDQRRRCRVPRADRHPRRARRARGRRSRRHLLRVRARPPVRAGGACSAPRTPTGSGCAVAALDVALDRADVYRIVQDSEGVPLP